MNTGSRDNSVRRIPEDMDEYGLSDISVRRSTDLKLL
jgi:hypothetical protein